MDASGATIQQSVSVELWHLVSKSLPTPYSRSEILLAVIKKYQVSNELSKRNLMAKLSALKHSQEPGENVDTFASKVLLILDQLKGMSNDLPSDLGGATIAPFMACLTGSFKTKADMVHEQVDLTWS
jgi:hypothetical protein